MIHSKPTTQTTQLKAFTFTLEGANGDVKEILSPLLTTEESAKNRAIAELLEYGTLKQEVEFTTYFTDLKVNDIISIYAPKYRIPKDLTKDRFIVKSVTHNFADGYAKTTIKAVRYD